MITLFMVFIGGAFLGMSIICLLGGNGDGE